MSAPAKTSDAQIIAAARAIIAARGVEALSLHLVAEAVGVRAPSLYKRFDDRAALLDAVREALLGELADLLRACAADTPAARLRAMAHGYRGFAAALGHQYPLLFAPGGLPTPAARAALAPLFETLAALLPPAQTLPAARALTAFLHGFVSMERHANFQLGGSVDAAFAFGLGAILTACERAPAVP